MLGKLISRAAALALVFAVTAAPATAQNFDGSGIVKFGVFGQGTFLEADITQPFAGSASPQGFAGGVSAGYDLVSPGHWLLGLEIDGSFGDARDSSLMASYGFDYLLTLRARAGIYARPNWLLYGTAGVGYLGMEIQNPGVGNKAYETLTGYVVGAGTEVDWHHVILFGEYLYGDFGDRSTTINGTRNEVSMTSNLLRVGLKFKVGHDYTHDLGGHDRYYEPLK